MYFISLPGVKPFEDILSVDTPFSSGGSAEASNGSAGVKSSLFDGKLLTLGNQMSMAVSHVGQVITRTG